MKELVKKLTEAWGPSGYEHHVREIVREEVKDLADEITVDPLGNMICRVGSGGKKIMVSAHMDEIGVMATYREKESGYLRFANIGGVNKGMLRGNRVRFEDGTMGVIGMHSDGGDKLDDFYIDVDDGAEHTVPEGSPAHFVRQMETRGSRMIAKSMDDRIGCVVAIEAMRKLNKQTENEVYFVFSVQEEVGLRGARTAAFGVQPDVGIAVDVTASGDMLKGPKMSVKLGDGTAIKVHDPGLVVPPGIVNWMVNTAESNDIPYQRELLSGGTTDAAAIQLAHAGVPSGCISIPCRYVHSVSETVDERDVQASIDLLTSLVKTKADIQL